MLKAVIKYRPDKNVSIMTTLVEVMSFDQAIEEDRLMYGQI